ncbi:MAG: phosphoribosylformylglycinamidine synthase, partial [Rhodospirillales bacterium]|nr:phosphoribosylformylglycinamidine synthase [Rhodospirillales bacterium]
AACHDCSDGGLLVAVAEMAMGRSCGVTLEAAPSGVPEHGYRFGEDQGRDLCATGQGAALVAAATAAGLPATLVGRTGGEALALAGGRSISIATLRASHEATLPALMGS